MLQEKFFYGMKEAQNERIKENKKSTQSENRNIQCWSSHLLGSVCGIKGLPDGV